jgi:uncharacterized membrane protein
MADGLHEVLQRLLWTVALHWPCHQMTSRSFVIRNRQLPLCARCFGVLLGPALAPLWIAYVPVSLSCFAVGLFIVDGFTQMLNWRASKNWLRFGTGIGCSAAVVSLLWSALRG